MKSYLKYFTCLVLLIASSKVSADPNFMSYCGDTYDCCPCEANWSGFYLTGQLGGAWHKHHARFRNANFFNTIGGLTLGNRFNYKSDGAFIGGGGIGMNYQWCNYVIGLEGGALGTNHRQHRRSPFFPATDRYSSNLHWLGFAKARLGYAYNCFLVFVTGGWAGTEPRIRLRSTPTGGAPITARSRNWINGWTVGAGIDYKVWECLSIGVAYDYMSFERHRRLSCAGCVGGTPRIKTNLYLQSVVFRLNYHFDLCNLW